VYLPDNVSFAAGACLGIPALTALHAVRLADLHSKRTVLIAGGAGAVAHYAIQFAKLKGARVIATVSQARKAEHARRAGADEIINYRTENVGQRVKALTDGAGVDAVIELDLSGNARLYPEILRAHGIVVVYGTAAGESSVPALWLMQNSITLKFFLIYDLAETERAALLGELSGLLAGNKLTHAIAQQLPLDEIAHAHDLSERGEALGNLVLDII
jgi:NADPH2:quinone reductase